MSSLWINDIYLKKIAKDLESYDVISFDVFDTLIFRSCYTPSHIFERVGEEINKLRHDWIYAPTAYKQLRITAEQRAGEKKGRGVDCSFEEIFREFPFSDEVKGQLAQLEINCEKDAQFLNQSVYSLLTDAFDKGKKIVVVSNMYYNSEQILQFLHCVGVDTNLISKVYVSSEQGCYKDSGQLFKCVLNDNNEVLPQRILHIGDNEKADIGGAKNVGVNAVHYGATNNKFGSIYDFERLKYNVKLGEIYAVRRLSTVNNPYDDEKLQFFYDFGAEVIGPVYTLFAEWIIRYAEKRGIDIILAFMREGELLSKVINRASKERNSSIVSVQTYISRHPAFVASIFEENYEERLSVLFRRNQINPRQLFEFFNIDAETTPFNNTEAINKMPFHQRSSFIEYLHTDSVRKTILQYSEYSRGLLLKYVHSITNGKPALSVDIGFKGTTQFFLNDIFKYSEWEQELIHSLMMGVSQTNILNIFNGADITTWLGFLRENEHEIDIVYRNPLLIECLVNSTCGSTYAYKDDNGKVIPLMEESLPEDLRKGYINAVWKGIENFQKSFLDAVKRKPFITEHLLEKKRDFLNILCRFMQNPSVKEAEIIGGFSYEDTFLNVSYQTFAGEMPPTGLVESEISEFLSRERKDGSYWPEAAIVQVYPQYGLKKILSDMNNILYANLFEICQRIKSDGLRKGYVFCASEVCVRFCEFAKLFEIGIEGVVDSDKRLHGSMVSGLKVVGINDIKKTPDYFFVASYVYAKEVSRIITDKFGSQGHTPKIFLLGE